METMPFTSSPVHPENFGLAIARRGSGNGRTFSTKNSQEREATTLRSDLNYYPACPQPELAMGASEHVDVPGWELKQITIGGSSKNFTKA